MGSALPVGREVLIPRQLSVAIDEGGIRTASGMLPALLYTTEGLERHGQREMVFAVIRTGTPAPGYPLTMARTVHRLAAEGRLVEAGDVSVFNQPGIDIDGRVTGFVYAAAPEDIPSTVRFERPPLVALPLLAGETAVVQRFGHARVLSLLGAQERYYPHPYWFRPGRAPVVDDTEFRAATMLSKAPAYNLPFLRVVHIGDRLELTITAGDATSYIGGADEELEAFEEALREAADVCAFLPGLADVPQTYVWAPGQQGPAAIVAPGGERSTRIGCNFLLLVRGTLEPTARQIEDGFAVLLTGAMYARLRQAVEAGRPIEIGLPAGAVRTIALRLEPRRGPASRPVQAVRPGPGTQAAPLPALPVGVDLGVDGRSGSGLTAVPAVPAVAAQAAADRYRTGELTIYRPPPAEDTGRSGPDAVGRELRHVDRGRIVLLTPEEQVRRATTAAELGDFIDRARGIVDRAFTGVRHGTEELMVEFRLGPSRPVAVRIMARPEAPPRELQVVLERQLLALRPPAIRHSEVAFQLHLQLFR
ncbi:hypothetical protein AB0H83_02105 [Dactylosporangium sp. NPDC050688]|uniref:hypothetical protein n=1 Tax=Dactylosporangium sp. NPDC050688 TaxID=3157217 RepID=UPI0033CF770B